MRPTTIPLDEAARIVDEFMAETAAQGNAESAAYFAGQKLRYIHTLAHIPRGSADKMALEVGSTDIFHIWMNKVHGYGRADCTTVNGTTKHKRYEQNGTTYFNVDLDREPIEAPDNTYDFILCAEVLEHLSSDPMYMLSELNRIMKPGGTILLTTPNITSARGLSKMLQGEAPYLFHVYFPNHLFGGRHNLEYSPGILKETMAAAGFEPEFFWTIDTFSPPEPAIINLLEQLKLPTDMRGDNMFYIGRKVSDVKERYPRSLYWVF